MFDRVLNTPMMSQTHFRIVYLLSMINYTMCLPAMDIKYESLSQQDRSIFLGTPFFFKNMSDGFF